MTIIFMVFGCLFLFTNCNFKKTPHIAAYKDFKAKTTLDSITWGDLTINDLKSEIIRNEVIFPPAIKFLKYSGAFFVLDKEIAPQLIEYLKAKSKTNLKLENFSEIIKEPSKFESELLLFSNKLNIPVELITKPSDCLKKFNNSNELNTYVLSFQNGNFIESNYLKTINGNMNTEITGNAYASGIFLIDNKDIILWVVVW